MSLTIIKSITPGSPAHRAGLRPGETLVAINGQRIVDVLDYKYYAYDPDLELTLKEGEDQRTVSLTKDVGEDLGLEFETYLMDKARSCANKCVFCFVDQLPKGMRDTLYFKDDDARLSFLMGNYITLTNLSRCPSACPCGCSAWTPAPRSGRWRRWRLPAPAPCPSAPRGRRRG